MSLASRTCRYGRSPRQLVEVQSARKATKSNCRARRRVLSLSAVGTNLPSPLRRLSTGELTPPDFMRAVVTSSPSEHFSIRIFLLVIYVALRCGLNQLFSFHPQRFSAHHPRGRHTPAPPTKYSTLPELLAWWISLRSTCSRALLEAQVHHTWQGETRRRSWKTPEDCGLH